MSDPASFSARPGDRAPGGSAALEVGRDPASTAGGGRVVLLHRAADRIWRHGDSERRATRRAIEDWVGLQQQDVLPKLRDLSPILNSLDWADRFLLASDPDPGRSVFVLCGSRVEAAFGQRLIGRMLCDVVGDKTALLRGCAQAASELRAVELEDATRDADGHPCLYRAVFMPVRGADPDHLYLMGVYGCATAQR